MTAVVLGLVTTALLMSLAGSFAPVFAAEAYVVAVALAQPTDVALLVASAVVAGQTLGKVAVLASVRHGCRRAAARSVRETVERRARHVPRVPVPAWWTTTTARATARVAPVRRWTLDAMDRPAAPLVVALSAAVGVPPLLAVTLSAGASTMRTTWFATACLTGRGVRMAALAVVPGALAGAVL